MHSGLIGAALHHPARVGMFRSGRKDELAGRTGGILDAKIVIVTVLTLVRPAADTITQELGLREEVEERALDRVDLPSGYEGVVDWSHPVG